MLHRLTMTLILIIAAVAATSCHAARQEYDKSFLHARESVLREDLLQLRKMIDQYTADKGSLPQSLDDLVDAGYMREIPDDPMTEKKDWKVVIGDDSSSSTGGKGVVDVHSASTLKSSEGKPYSEW